MCLDESADALPDPGLARVRAELIRVQVERLRCPYWLPGETSRYAELRRREEAIQNQFAQAILGPAAGTGTEVWFSRGFPCLRMPAATFIGHAHRFAHLRPPVLKVTDAADRWYDVFTHPHLALVTDLVLYGQGPWNRAADSWSLSASVIGRMGELGGHNRLRGLDLSRCRIGDGGLYELVEYANVWRLEDLDLSHNDIEYGGLMELLLSSIPATLRRVNLCGNPIADLGAEAIAKRWPDNPALKWIRLEGTRIGPRGRRALRDRFGDRVELDAGA